MSLRVKLVALLLLTMATVAGAQNRGGAQYQVEVLVFAHDRTPDVPHVQPELPEYEWGALPEDVGDDVRPAAVQSLTPLWGRLERLQDYRPIVMTAWQQGRDSTPVRVSGGERLRAPGDALFSLGGPDEELPREVEGVLTLKHEGSRMYLSVDARYARPGPAPRAQESRLAARQPRSAAAPVQWQFHRLDQSRPVSAGRLNYFDHHQFGILVLVTPLEN